MNVFRRKSQDNEDGGGAVKANVPKVNHDSHADAKAYNAMVSASVDLSDASVSNGIFSVIRSVRDIDNANRRNFLYTIPIPQGNGFFPFSIPPTQLSETIVTRIPSPSGDKIAILRNEPSKAEEKKQVLEIWTHDCQALSRRIVLPPSLHGKVINDPNWFGRIAWNIDETALVYSAERKNPAVASFFKTDQDNDDTRGGEFTLGLGKMETWGEKYTKLSGLLDLFIVNVETGRVGQVENTPGGVDDITTHSGYTLGQAIFSPCGTHVVYTGWDAGGGSEMPRRLGMIYCMQRPSKIYASPVKLLLQELAESDVTAKGDLETYVCLTPSARLSRTPRFSPTRSGLSRMAFLSSKLGFDTHNGGVALHVLDWNVKDALPILDSQRVWVETYLYPVPRNAQYDIQVANMGFPGIYTHQLPLSCCTNDYLLLTTQWGSVQKILRVSLSDGTFALLNVDILRGNGQASEPLASQSLLCVTADGGAIIAESAPNRPVIVAYVSPAALSRESVPKKVEATLVAEMAPIAATCFSTIPVLGLDNVLNFSYDVLTMRPPQIEDDVDTPVQWIFLRPKDTQPEGKKPPLIIVPHGGPHSCTSTDFMPSYAFLCAHGGYAILHVNYRGSTGFGQGALEALPGNIGLLDVKDIVHAAITISDSGWVDPQRIGICGGSHGGFLAGHCIGQFPDLFKAAAMRNPVTNIASMVTATDIPDWCYVETLGCGYYKWKEFRGARKEELNVMWDASPIRYAHNVVAPTLIALGMSDQRVPPSQGLEFYHMLRSNGVKTKLLMYDDDDHAIDKVLSEADHWINIKQWFDEYLKPESLASQVNG